MMKSITNCVLVSFALVGLAVNTTFAAGDGYDNAQAQTGIYLKGYVLIVVLLVGLLAVGIKTSRRSHQENS